MEETTFWIIIGVCVVGIFSFVLYIYFNTISVNTMTTTPTPTPTVTPTVTPTPNIIKNDLSLTLDQIAQLYPNAVMKTQTSKDTILVSLVPSYKSDVNTNCLNNCDIINSNSYMSCAPGYSRVGTSNICQLDFTNPLNAPLVPDGYNVCHSYFDNSGATTATTQNTQNFIIDYRKNCN